MTPLDDEDLAMMSEPDNLTYGQAAVGLTFNPSNNMAVDSIKRRYASLIDDLDGLRKTTDDGEVKRLCSVAITEAQGAQMWAVKAVTWRTKS